MNALLHDDLAELGFAFADGRWRRNGTAFATDGRWSLLQTHTDATGFDPLKTKLGQPGLWKPLRAGNGATLRVFDLPPSMFSADSDDTFSDAEPGWPVKACVRWALDTADGRLPDGWQSPPRAEVESWIPRGGLTVQFRSVLRQGSLHHGPDRLALRFPVVPRLPADLPAHRRAWLREILCDAQSRARMARLGVGAGGGIEAEVDLSGAPRSAVEGLFGMGLESLRWLVEWLEIADFVVSDAASACRAFEVCAMRA
jgi:hypothetical protein